MLKGKVVLLSLIASLILTLTGCGGKEITIFQERRDPNKITELKDSELAPEVFYVKNGTRFSQVYKVPKYSKVINLGADIALVPTLYKGDTLALKSQSTNFKGIKLIRFYDAGYSIAIRNARYSEQRQAIAFNYQEDVFPNTNAASQLDHSNGNEMYIDLINGEPVTAEMLDNYGVINGFEQNGTYQIGYYAGTTYGETSIRAASRMLEAWEEFTLSEAIITKRGYMNIEIPVDFKSGWYYIENQGMFRYIAEPKSAETQNMSFDAMNEKYYSGDMEMNSFFTQAYSINFDIRTIEPMIEVVYDRSNIQLEAQASATVVSPDGITYTMEPSERPAADNAVYSSAYVGYLTCTLQEAMAGKWMIYISPKSIQVLDVKVLSNGMSEEITEEDTEIIVDEDAGDMQFFATWEGADSKSIVYATVVAEDGETFELVDSGNKEIHQLIYNVAYLKKGTYTLRVYHYSDTEITDAGLRPAKSGEDESVVISIQE